MLGLLEDGPAVSGNHRFKLCIGGANRSPILQDSTSGPVVVLVGKPNNYSAPNDNH